MENHHVHVRTKLNSKNSGVGNNCSKIGYDKAATRRLRTIILRSSRLGLTVYEIAKLPGAKKFYPRRRYQRWKISVFIVIIIGAGLAAVALLCTAARRKCFRIEDINLAT